MSECFLYNNCSRIHCNESFCIRRHKMEILYKLSYIPENKRCPIALHPDNDGTDRDVFVQLAAVKNNIVEYVKEGKNLYLYSNLCGNGKTSWAFKLANSYLNSPEVWPYCSLKNSTVLYVSVPKFLQALKDAITTKNKYASFISDNILTADLVIFDEIGADAATKFEKDKLYTVIDERITSNKANIFTSNIEGADLIAAIGPKLASRIQKRSTTFEFKGSDKRHLTAGLED